MTYDITINCDSVSEQIAGMHKLVTYLVDGYRFAVFRRMGNKILGVHKTHATAKNFVELNELGNAYRIIAISKICYRRSKL